MRLTPRFYCGMLYAPTRTPVTVNICKLLFSFHHVGLGDRTLVPMLGTKYLYQYTQLSHWTTLGFCWFETVFLCVNGLGCPGHVGILM